MVWFHIWKSVDHLTLSFFGGFVLALLPIRAFVCYINYTIKSMPVFSYDCSVSNTFWLAVSMQSQLLFKKLHSILFFSNLQIPAIIQKWPTQKSENWVILESFQTNLIIFTTNKTVCKLLDSIWCISRVRIEWIITDMGFSIRHWKQLRLPNSMTDVLKVYTICLEIKGSHQHNVYDLFIKQAVQILADLSFVILIFMLKDTNNIMYSST